MKEQTKKEIQRCQEYLQRTDISEHDRQMAERGAADWFTASLFEDGLMAGIFEEHYNAMQKFVDSTKTRSTAMEKKELKPAFPNPAFGVAHFGQGMTLRDWFAGMALSGWYTNSGHLPDKSYLNSHAEHFYLMADIMLSERERDLQSTQGKEDREKIS